MDATGETIKSEQEAHDFAYRWAVERELDTGKLSRCAVSLFKERQSLTADDLARELQNFSTVTGATASFWSDWSRNAWRKQSLWVLETVKHLAIINAAGLAGTLTLLSNMSEPIDSRLRTASVLFIIGLVFALLCFWAFAHAHAREAIAAENRALDVKRSVSWKQYKEAIDKPYDDKAENRWYTFSGFVGVGATITAISGGILLIFIFWQ